MRRKYARACLLFCYREIALSYTIFVFLQICGILFQSTDVAVQGNTIAELDYGSYENGCIFLLENLYL